MNDKLKKLRVIAKAKFSDKSNLGDWYQKRLDICNQCPLNSANKKDLSLKDKAIVAMNFGKPSCLACTCEIEAKASVREETCGLIKLNEQPLWKALPTIEEVDFGLFKVENLNADKVKLLPKSPLLIDYGVVKYKGDTEIEISFEDKENKTTNVRATSSCGCTVPTPRKVGDKYFINIKYDSKILGKFEKTITLKVTRENKLNYFPIKIQGTVIN